ncbi:hypothetical protein MPC4_10182 [Methylocella tundrae]|uniref:Uncharacterized protein n=1 Tax=Methylocella tundrae TaxID=227605 RepID=A0A8B6M242_METTU|nr:hypothetical protein MPC1_9890002 [Methylocella tundrae]VTZ48232.1 hypothetical protein MPC4_10182 [Methylocella tundrae]
MSRRHRRAARPRADFGAPASGRWAKVILMLGFAAKGFFAYGLFGYHFIQMSSSSSHDPGLSVLV